MNDQERGAGDDVELPELAERRRAADECARRVAGDLERDVAIVRPARQSDGAAKGHDPRAGVDARFERRDARAPPGLRLSTFSCRPVAKNGDQRTF